MIQAISARAGYSRVSLSQRQRAEPACAGRHIKLSIWLFDLLRRLTDDDFQRFGYLSFSLSSGPVADIRAAVNEAFGADLILDAGDPPKDLLCPLTLDLFEDPVVASDGQGQGPRVARRCGIAFHAVLRQGVSVSARGPAAR